MKRDQSGWKMVFEPYFIPSLVLVKTHIGKFCL